VVPKAAPLPLSGFAPITSGPFDPRRSITVTFGKPLLRTSFDVDESDAFVLGLGITAFD